MLPNFIRTSTHTTTECKNDARWSRGRRSTSIRLTAAGHTRARKIYTYRQHAYSACAATRASAARPARCARLGRAPAERLRPCATPSPHARRSGVPLSAPARRHARRRRPRDEAAAAARLLVAPPPVAPSAAKGLEDVAPVRPGSLAIRGGHANNPPRQPTIGRPPQEGCKPRSLEPPATSLESHHVHCRLLRATVHARVGPMRMCSSRQPSE